MAGLTMIGSVSGELSLSPASLTDFTQKTYSLPGCSPGTVNLGEQVNMLVFVQSTDKQSFEQTAIRFSKALLLRK